MQCNVLFDGFTGVEFRSEDGGLVEDVVFARNLMHDFSDYALKFDGTNGARVLNNTFVDAGNDGLRIEGAGLDDGEVRNNLWVRTGSVEGGGFIADHNGYWETGSVGIASGTDVSADPLLDGDYHLSDGSPMIDTGVDVGFEYGGEAPDLGFHERGIDGCQPEPGTGASGGGGGSGATGGGSSGGSSSGGSSSAGGTSASGAPLGATPDESGDCGCRAAPRRSPSAMALGLLLIGALGALGSRRRGRVARAARRRSLRRGERARRPGQARARGTVHHGRGRRTPNGPSRGRSPRPHALAAHQSSEPGLDLLVLDEGRG